jgi:hypothetical protein
MNTYSVPVTGAFRVCPQEQSPAERGLIEGQAHNHEMVAELRDQIRHLILGGRKFVGTRATYMLLGR